MRQSSEQRRLLAVLVADIVGYSRLMAEDEADTFHRLKDLQSSPIAPATVGERADIISYRAAAPKAAAYHPSGGRVFTVLAAETQRAAEEQALKNCNADPTRNGADGNCFLYAVGDQVVLPQRRREPLTAAPAR